MSDKKQNSTIGPGLCNALARCLRSRDDDDRPNEPHIELIAPSLASAFNECKVHIEALEVAKKDVLAIMKRMGQTIKPGDPIWGVGMPGLKKLADATVIDPEDYCNCDY